MKYHIIKQEKMREILIEVGKFKDIVTYENSGSKTLRLGVLELDPKRSINLHKHPCEEVFYFLEGNGKFVVEKKEFEVLKGDAVYIAENIAHKVINIGKSPLRYLYAASILLRAPSSKDSIPLEER